MDAMGRWWMLGEMKSLIFGGGFRQVVHTPEGNPTPTYTQITLIGFWVIKKQTKEEKQGRHEVGREQ